MVNSGDLCILLCQWAAKSGQTTGWPTSSQTQVGKEAGLDGLTQSIWKFVILFYPLYCRAWCEYLRWRKPRAEVSGRLFNLILLHNWVPTGFFHSFTVPLPGIFFSYLYVFFKFYRPMKTNVGANIFSSNFVFPNSICFAMGKNPELVVCQCWTIILDLVLFAR